MFLLVDGKAVFFILKKNNIAFFGVRLL